MQISLPDIPYPLCCQGSAADAQGVQTCSTLYALTPSRTSLSSPPEQLLSAEEVSRYGIRLLEMGNRSGLEVASTTGGYNDLTLPSEIPRHAQHVKLHCPDILALKIDLKDQMFALSE